MEMLAFCHLCELSALKQTAKVKPVAFSKVSTGFAQNIFNLSNGAFPPIYGQRNQGAVRGTW